MCMAGGHKAKNDPTRWVVLEGDYRRDLYRGGIGFFFTVRVAPGVPALSQFTPETFQPQYTPLGKLVQEKLFGLITHAKGALSLDTYVLMPDHLHICIWAERELPRTPLQYFTTMLLFAEREAREKFGIEKLWQLPGTLHLCYSTERYGQKKAYTQGNITRWHLKHERRDLSVPHHLSHPKLPAPYEWRGYGNEALLDADHLLPCYISSSTPEADILLFERLATHLAAAGWTLIGGFVSSRERALLAAVRKQVPEAKVIHLVPTHVIEEKPSAQLSLTLRAGNFLRLTSVGAETQCMREHCVWHNLWIEALCQGWRQKVETFFKERNADAQKIQNMVRFLNRWRAPDPRKYRGTRSVL